MNKWEVDEHKQWSDKMRSRRFCPHTQDKNRNLKGSDKRKLFVEAVWMNGLNFKNETFSLPVWIF